MLIVVLTVTMKTLFDSRGIALIVLVIAMTLIAVLGASFVSMVGSRHKASFYQINSYRALNTANTGLEYAIRFASDATLSDNSNFYVTPLTTKTFSFAGGTFDITYRYNNPCNNNDSVTINSSINGAKRQVMLYNFRRYVSRFTHVPIVSVRPNPAGKRVHIPILNNDNSALTIQLLILSVEGGGVDKTLEELCFSTNPVDSCTESGTLNRVIPQTGAEISFSKSEFSGSGHVDIPSDRVLWCHLIFRETTTNGKYNVKLYVGVAGEQPSSIKFNIPTP